MARRVSLPMYDLNPAAVDRYWQGLRRHMIAAGLTDVPDLLDRPNDLKEHWLAPDLLLSQTCGYPLVTSLAGRVRYVATPRYSAAGCDGPLYRSAVVVREDDPMLDLVDAAGKRVAFNSEDSQSGYNGLRACVAPLAIDGRFFAGAIETGGHRLSVKAVQAGQADLAAIDVVTLALLREEVPDEVRRLRILCFTEAVPGLPLITSQSTSEDDVIRLRGALETAARDPALADVQAALLIDGSDVLHPSIYESILATRDRAIGRGYPALA